MPRGRSFSMASRKSSRRPDLADRSIFLTLPPIADARRQSERELWREFELARPRILGALLDLVVHGLRTLPGIGLDRLPRMADFALWAAACETALWPPGTFARAYEANRRAAIESIIDADPVAACVREIMTERSSWTGSAADLLRAGAGRSCDGIRRAAPAGPKTRARSLAACVARRRSCGHWASTLRSVVKAEPEAGSSGCVRARTTVRTVSSVREHGPAGQDHLRRQLHDVCDDNCAPFGRPVPIE